MCLLRDIFYGFFAMLFGAEGKGWGGGSVMKGLDLSLARVYIPSEGSEMSYSDGAQTSRALLKGGNVTENLQYSRKVE